MLARARERIRELWDAVLTGPGHLDFDRRRAIARRSTDPPEAAAVGPDELARYVDKVARQAYRVTSDDVVALREAGLSEDQIFEATIVAAVAASRVRLERGVAALREEP